MEPVSNVLLDLLEAMEGVVVYGDSVFWGVLLKLVEESNDGKNKV